MLAGPPNFNTLYREFADDRDYGSPEIEPIFHNGRTVRFAARPGREIAPASQPWNRSRVLYLVHPSDPVVWWSPALLLTRPDWLEEPAGDDVLDAMVWIPFITFWQVTADLPIALGAPSGHGHNYSGDHVDGWATVLEPSGWNAERAIELRQIVTAGDD